MGTAGCSPTQPARQNRCFTLFCPWPAWPRILRFLRVAPAPVARAIPLSTSSRSGSGKIPASAVDAADDTVLGKFIVEHEHGIADLMWGHGVEPSGCCSRETPLASDPM